jgi:hypothetical protein
VGVETKWIIPPGRQIAIDLGMQAHSLDDKLSQAEVELPTRKR